MSKKLLFTLEFPVRCSPAILFEFLSTASGLQEWFADRVDEWENVFSFSWNGGTPDKAEILDQEENKFIRFRWLHSEKNEYFEFCIEKTEISNQTVLIIKDHYNFVQKIRHTNSQGIYRTLFGSIDYFYIRADHAILLAVH